MDQRFENELKKVLSERQVKTGEPMEMHTTFRVGGPADYFVLPETKEELRETVLLCRREEMPYYILGIVSNLLVSDKGYR